jgi:hypothetical protein
VNGIKGEAFTHMLKLDKSSNSGVLDLPTVTSVSQLEIHAAATTGRQFTLSIWNSGTSAWDLYGTYATTVDTENIFLINFASPLTNAKFRIIDISTGAFSFYKIKTHTTQPTALTAPTAGTASAITATTCTANWTPVDINGTNYEVKVYKGTTLKVTATTTGGQATSSIAITGLQADSTYTYKVKAIGDGDNLYSDSYQSLASAAFTMAHQVATPVLDAPSVIHASGFTANWQAVANAISYDVMLYEGVNYISTTNVSSGTSLAYLSLTQGTTYTYKVKAIGDNSVYFDSYISAGMDAIPSPATAIDNTKMSIFVSVQGKSILLSEIGDIEVYNLQGAQLIQKQGVNKINTNLENGLYVVRFTNNSGKQFVQKVIIK